MKLEESFGMSAMTTGNFAKGLPFYGTKGDFNFTSGRSQFTPGISISQAPLTDMSRHGDPGLSEFDVSIAKLKMYFKPGDRVRGILVNSQLNSKDGKMVIGKLKKFVPDYHNGTINAFIVDPKTLKEYEIYVDTIERIYESSTNRALSFSQFINS